MNFILNLISKIDVLPSWIDINFCEKWFSKVLSIMKELLFLTQLI